MSNFIDDNTSLPVNKVDDPTRPLTTPANMNVTAAEWNSVMQALLDTRTFVQALLTVSASLTKSATIPVTSGTAVGTFVLKVAPVAGGNWGWICTATGGSDTWKEFGLISL